MALDLQYEPEIAAEDITVLTQEEWKRLRQDGIGGSDAAAACGLSPWKTARDLYEEKTGNRVQSGQEDNWVAKEIGKRLEELVVQIFMKKTGLRPYAIRRMFRHPLYSFMLANVDYFVEIDGEVFLIECKTSFSFRIEEWENGCIPRHYELQGRHYMAVTNVNGVIFLCLHGNNEASFLMRRLDRDLELEEELIEQEAYFWQEFVLKRQPPPYTEQSSLILKSIRERMEIWEGSQVALPDRLQENVVSYLELKKQKSELDKQIQSLDERMRLAYAPVQEALGGAEKGTIMVGGQKYQAGYTKRTETAINKQGMEALRLKHPDICKEYAKTRTSRIFYIKPEKAG